MKVSEVRGMDYSIFETNNKFYSGAERKFGIIIDGEDYIVKFQKKERFGMRNNHISEFIGCKIFSMLGFETQDVALGTYNDENVVVLKDFTGSDETFVAFNDVGDSSLDEDKEKYQYSYTDIIEMLKLNNKLEDEQETINQFYRMFIVDALIGNFDRHGANWGFIKKNNKYRLSPVFDNGSCLFPRLTEESEMLRIIASEEEVNDRIYKFPTSQILLNGKKSSYFEVINSLEFEECNNALIYIYSILNMEEIYGMINGIREISDIQKKFYNYMLKERYEKIIKASYLGLER